ncbi:5-hydroxyisourate hydrolase [Nesidiocoris tenuis]|uniref:5-hydroxyisourate hydrolase n=1 Tax=Nesidiocoris tenuis TaxID=355587 RepID=A0ABN7BAH1_9HEMI|nr:5-hydroxyisourate hydrolase [Nesidiocoris tenuis]
MSGAGDRLEVVSRHLATSPTSAMSSDVIPITSHVLDLASGLPASGLAATLFKKNSDGSGWTKLNSGRTNPDGRLPGLTSPGSISAGVHMMKFETGEYFAARNLKTFYPYVEVTFNIEDGSQHYHVPLLLSPYGYSTYRGS